MNAAALLHPAVPPKAVDIFRSVACSISIRDDLDNADPIHAALVFGGDGTIHRHLAALRDHKTPLLVVPKGSGNDFAKALGIRSEAAALRAWKLFCESGGRNVAEIDLGLIRSAKGETLFCCIAGAGLDSMANERANRMPAWLRGTAGYLLAAVESVFRFRSTEITVAAAERKINRRGLLVAVGNAHRYGRGMKIAPHAELNDGLLDICFVGEMNRLKLLSCVPTIFFGAHLGIKQVEYLKSAAVRIESERALEVFADGEFTCYTPADISVLPGGLRVIIPKIEVKD